MSAKSPARSTGPPSSPRLPSPPPLPELQLGPRSPSINATGGELSLEEAAAQDEGAARRIRPGTSAAEMARGPPFVPLHQLESPFQLQEYLKSSYCDATRDDNSNTVKPITKESAMQLATPPIQQDTGDPVDRNLWLYELCRFLVQRTNRLIVSFFADSPPCSSQTCPEMRASEWQYLCAVHEPPKSCCAIDYCCHTLDWAANVLTSPKHFPSRLSLGGEGGSAYQSMRQLTNIFRRVYRIYAHAWFQHREAFWSLEQEEGLYKFFRTVCDAYSLIPEDNYTIPSDAEAEREDTDTPIMPRQSAPYLLKKELAEPTIPQSNAQEPETEPAIPALGPTVRRHGHRHTPSTGTHVTMIAEGPEEEEERVEKTVEQVQPESLAALSEQLSSGPLKIPNEPTPRSPRPTMTIPIDDNKEDLRAPEDPTPTPERHASDPFADQSSLAVIREAAEVATSPPADESQIHIESTEVEPEASLGATTTNSEKEAPLQIAMPSLITSTPPRAVNEDEEVLSPGGGSIRTIGGDILSGILAHVDSEPLSAIPFSRGQSSVGATTEEERTAVKNVESSEKESDPTTKTETEEHEKKDEDLEEMGEIKLVETTILRDDHDHESNKEADVSALKEEGEATEKKEDSSEETRDDGTKPEDTPSGVV